MQKECAKGDRLSSRSASTTTAKKSLNKAFAETRKHINYKCTILFLFLALYVHDLACVTTGTQSSTFTGLASKVSSFCQILKSDKNNLKNKRQA